MFAHFSAVYEDDIAAFFSPPCPMLQMAEIAMKDGGGTALLTALEEMKTDDA